MGRKLCLGRGGQWGSTESLPSPRREREDSLEPGLLLGTPENISKLRNISILKTCYLWEQKLSAELSFIEILLLLGVKWLGREKSWLTDRPHLGESIEEQEDVTSARHSVTNPRTFPQQSSLPAKIPGKSRIRVTYSRSRFSCWRQFSSALKKQDPTVGFFMTLGSFSSTERISYMPHLP